MANLEETGERIGCPVPFCATFGCQGAIAPHCKILAEAEKARLASQPPAKPESLVSWADVHAIVESDAVMAVYSATEWNCLSEDGQTWLWAIVNEAVRRERGA